MDEYTFEQVEKNKEPNSNQFTSIEIIGFIFSILGLFGSCCGGFVFSTTGLILSIIQLNKKKTPFAVAGLILGIIGLAMMLIITIVFLINYSYFIGIINEYYNFTTNNRNNFF